MHCKAFPPPSVVDRGLEIVYEKKKEKKDANIFVLQLDGWYAEKKKKKRKLIGLNECDLQLKIL